MRFEYSDTDTVDLNYSKRIRSQIRLENIYTVFTPTNKEKENRATVWTAFIRGPVASSSGPLLLSVVIYIYAPSIFQDREDLRLPLRLLSSRR